MPATRRIERDRTSRPGAFFALEAQELLARGSARQAVELCKRGLTHHPGNPTGYVVLALAYLALDEKERGLNVLRDGFRRTGSQRLNELAAEISGESGPKPAEEPSSEHIAEPPAEPAPEPVSEPVSESIVETEPDAEQTSTDIDVEEQHQPQEIPDEQTAVERQDTIADIQEAPEVSATENESPVISDPIIADEEAPVDIVEEHGLIAAEHDSLEMPEAEPEVIDEAMPVADEVVIDEVTPVAEEAVIDEVVPVADEAVIDEVTPAADEVIDITTPAAEEVVIDEVTPTADEVMIDEVLPVAEEVVIDEVTPLAEELVIDEISSAEPEAIIEQSHPLEEPPVAEESAIPDELITVEEFAVDDEPVVHEELITNDEPIEVEEPVLDEIAAAPEPEPIPEEIETQELIPESELVIEVFEPDDVPAIPQVDIPTPEEQEADVEATHPVEAPVPEEQETPVADAQEEPVPAAPPVQRDPAPHDPARTLQMPLRAIEGRTAGDQEHHKPVASHDRSRPLALHLGRNITRLRSSNLRLIPGLEFAPLRHEDQLHRQSIAPLINEPMPMPESAAGTRRKMEEKMMPPLPPLGGAIQEREPVQISEVESKAPAEDIVPQPVVTAASRPEPIQEPEPEPKSEPVQTSIPFQAMPSPEKPAPEERRAQEDHGGNILKMVQAGRIEAELTPLEELARRLENARIPAVQDVEHRTSYEPSIVSETLANILVSQGAYTEALKAFQTLARLKPERFDYYQQRIKEMKWRIQYPNRPWTSE